MIYTLKNEQLTLEIATLGAELRSVKNAEGTEFMWQGDSRYWGGTAPWLFPICGRLHGTGYTYQGVEYPMERHGFARRCEFAVREQSSTALTMVLTPNEKTRAVYPFDFLFEIAYRLDGNRVFVTLTVVNKGREIMPAAVGGHPGFSLPLGGVGSYDDCYLEFSTPCTPCKVIFSENLLDSGVRSPYPLEDGRRIPLSRELFANDAIFLCDMASAVTLRSKKSEHAVQVSYGDIPYLGIWSAASGGDFVCIEPWCGMASLEGVTALEEKSDMMQIAPGEARTVELDIAFC